MIKDLEINEIKKLKDINLIDIRTKLECMLGVIPNSKHIEMNELIRNHQKYLNKNETYYLYCRSGNRSYNTAVELDKLGYKIVNLTGGYSAYQK